MEKNEAGTGAFAWEEPPKRGHRRPLFNKLRPLVVQLRARPGKWARLLEYGDDHGAASAAQRARALFLDCEFTARSSFDGGSAMWGRFVGEDNEYAVASDIQTETE